MYKFKRTLWIIAASLIITSPGFAQAPEKMSYQAVIRDTGGDLVTNQSVGIFISILKGSVTGPSVYEEIYNPNPETNANGLVTVEIGGGVSLSGVFSDIDWSDGPYFIQTEIDPTGGTNYSISGTSQLLSVPFAFHSKTAESVTGEIDETDPVFTQSPAAGIENSHLNQWNESHAWGDHSEAGYLTDYTVTESDVTTHQQALEISEDQIIDLQDYLTEESQDLSHVLSQGNNASDAQIKNLANPTHSQDAATKAYVDASAPTTYQIGDFAHGGVVFWVDETGQRGLVADFEDMPNTYKWRGGNVSYRTNVSAVNLFAGKANTAMILSVFYAKDDFDVNAALICYQSWGMNENYTYNDWYLPSNMELYQMYQNRDAIDSTAVANGGNIFANELYWSSSEWSLDFPQNAAAYHFNTGTLFSRSKNQLYKVRCIRSF